MFRIFRMIVSCFVAEIVALFLRELRRSPLELGKKADILNADFQNKHSYFLYKEV